MSEEFLNLIRKRRTIRRYTEEEVSQEQVELLLELAMCAPNRLNRQPWRFVVIRDKELQRQLAELLNLHPYLRTASVVIAVCALPEASTTWMMDISAATENLLLGATAIGLGAAWVGAPGSMMWDLAEETLHDALHIPLNLRIPALVTLGHPAEEREPHGRHDRFNNTWVHYGRWGELKLD